MKTDIEAASIWWANISPDERIAKIVEWHTEACEKDMN